MNLLWRIASLFLTLCVVAQAQILARKAPVTPSTAQINLSAQLAADLETLIERKIIDSAEYWLANAIKGGQCDGERVEPLLRKMAATFEPAPTGPDAIRILAAQKVIASPAFWEERAVPGGKCSGYNVRVLIHNFIRKSKR